MRISCLLACFCLLALLCACAAPEAALPEPPAAQVQSPEEPPAPVEPPVEPIIEEEPEPALLLSEPVWLLGRLTELYCADETEWAALADILEAAKPLNTDAQMLAGVETIRFQAQDYVPLAEAAQRLGLEWGEAPDGLRYLARRQTVGQIPEGWNVPVLMYHAVGDEIWGYSDLFVSEAGMEEQLQYLQENGYEPIWFSDLAHIEDYEKPVILTFDDGYDDNYTVLYPLLEKYQTKATIFVIGNAMGQLGDDIGGGRRHQNQVRSGGQGDVGNVILKVPGKGVHHTPVVGQGLKGQGGNKLSGVLGHHHMDLRPRFPQGAGHVGHFIGGNAAGHTQQDALSLQIFHESLAPISPAYRRILLHVPTGGMAQAMSLSRPCFS